MTHHPSCPRSEAVKFVMETKYSTPLLPAHPHAGGQGSRGTEVARAGLTGDRGGTGRAPLRQL